MKRTIITYGGYFERFMMTLNAAERRKIDYILSLLESGDRVPVKFMRLIRDGLYELRMEFGGNCYRIFFIFLSSTITRINIVYMSHRQTCFITNIFIGII